MTTIPSVDDILSGGAPSLKFPTVGTVHKGTVTSVEAAQQTDFDTGQPLTWDDGNPRMQVVLSIQTDERDAEIADDNGERRLFVKGQMLTALRQALKAASAKTVVVGDQIAVKYASDGEAKKRGFSPPKVYLVQIEPGAGAVAAVIETADDNDLLR